MLPDPRANITPTCIECGAVIPSDRDVRNVHCLPIGDYRENYPDHCAKCWAKVVDAAYVGRCDDRKRMVGFALGRERD